jgi:MFS family permease
VLTSIMAAGSLGGSLASAHRSRPTTRYLVTTGGTFAGLLALAAAAPTVVLESIVLVPAGAAGIMFLATANATFQLRTPGFLRGRVMAFYSFVFVGGTAVGGPIAGWVSEAFGPRMGFVLGAVTSAGAVGWVLVRARGSAARAARAAASLEALPAEDLVTDASRSA